MELKTFHTATGGESLLRLNKGIFTWFIYGNIVDVYVGRYYLNNDNCTIVFESFYSGIAPKQPIPLYSAKLELNYEIDNYKLKFHDENDDAQYIIMETLYHDIYFNKDFDFLLLNCNYNNE